MPTQMPEPRLVMPTPRPAQNIEYPANRAMRMYPSSATGSVGNPFDGRFVLFVNRIAKMTPYIAVASQKMTLIKFFERMRGALIDAPRMLLPVIKIPQAAPITCFIACVLEREKEKRRRRVVKC